MNNYSTWSIAGKSYSSMFPSLCCLDASHGGWVAHGKAFCWSKQLHKKLNHGSTIWLFRLKNVSQANGRSILLYRRLLINMDLPWSIWLISHQICFQSLNEIWFGASNITMCAHVWLFGSCSSKFPHYVYEVMSPSFKLVSRWSVVTPTIAAT